MTLPPQYHGFQIRHLAVLDDVLEDGAVVEEVLIPVEDAERQRLREERRAKHDAEDAVERGPRERPSTGPAGLELARPLF